MVKAAGVAAGTLFIAIGLSAQFGGAHLFAQPAQAHHAVSQAPSPASPSPQPSPSLRPSPQVEAITAAGTIYRAPAPVAKKKKHGKG